MNCLNCGAPLQFVVGQTALKCTHCQSMRHVAFDADDGDRVLSLQEPSELNCPRCASEMVRGLLDGHSVDQCPDCHGFLVPADVFADVTRKRRRSYRGPEIAPQPYDPEVLQRVIDCPKCERRMEVHPHYGAGRAVIDSCSHCHLVWLDNAEMTSIERTPGIR